MLGIQGLIDIATARLKDAESLLAQHRYDGARYLCGYAVEIALKARIVRTLGLDGFPQDSGEFPELKSLQTHNLKMLLTFSGWSPPVELPRPSLLWRL